LLGKNVKINKETIKEIIMAFKTQEELIKVNIDQDFAEEAKKETVQKKEALPWLQCLNTKGLIQSIEKENKPYGIFFAKETVGKPDQISPAKNFGFVPEEPWKKTIITFNEDNPVEVEGYFTTRLRCVFLNIGQAFIEERLEDGTVKYVGLAYKSGKPTQAYLDWKGNGTKFKLKKKTLLLPLNKSNTIMSNAPNLTPVTFTLGLGISATLGPDIAWYYELFDQVLRQALNQEGKTAYKQTIRNKFVVDFELKLRKNKRGSNFLAPSKFLIPTLYKDQIGKTFQRVIPGSTTYSERIVELEYVSLNDLLIPSKSDTGVLITGLYEQYVANKPKEIAMIDGLPDDLPF
jgi:hypothetical protein